MLLWTTAWDQFGDSSLLLLPVPGTSLTLAQLHGHPHVSKKPSMQQEQPLSPQYQSLLAIAYPFFPLSLSRLTNNQGLDQEEVVTGV